MKRILFSAAALMCLTGCSSGGLVHDKAYLRAAAVSEGTETRLTLAFFSEEDETVTVSGGSIDEAVSEAELRVGKPLFTGFAEMVILDENSSGSAEIMEHMLKEWKVSPECIIACSKGGMALLENESAERLSGSVKEAVRQGRSPDSGLVNVLGKLLRDGEAEVAELSGSGADGAATIKKHRS